MNTPEKPSKPVKAPKPKATPPKVTKPRVSKPKAPLTEGARPRKKRATTVKKTVPEPQHKPKIAKVAKPAAVKAEKPVKVAKPKTAASKAVKQ